MRPSALLSRLVLLVGFAAVAAHAQPSRPSPDSLGAQWARAIAAEDEQAIDALLVWGPTPDVPGDPPLYLAARQGRTALVRRLLAAGADPDTQSRMRGGATPLHAALYHARTDAAEVLLAAGASLTYRSAIGFAAFDWALEKGDVPSMQRVLEALAADAAPAEAASYALVRAVLDGDASAMRDLLASGADPDLSNAARYGPLAIAARLDQAPLVRLLLDAGANPDIGDVARDEASPLHQSARGGSLEPARLLLAAGADPNKLNARGFTALHLAALYDRAALAAALLDAGTDPAVRSVDPDPSIGEYTAFDFAVEQGRLVVADTLLAKSAPATPADRLARAALTGDTARLKAMLQAGADPDRPSTPGVLPLALAARFGHLEAVQILLADGADPNGRGVDRYGMTALMHAARSDAREVLAVLIEGVRRWTGETATATRRSTGRLRPARAPPPKSCSRPAPTARSEASAASDPPTPHRRRDTPNWPRFSEKPTVSSQGRGGGRRAPRSTRA